MALHLMPCWPMSSLNTPDFHCPLITKHLQIHSQGEVLEVLGGVHVDKIFLINGSCKEQNPAIQLPSE